MSYELLNSTEIMSHELLNSTEIMSHELLILLKSWAMSY